METKELKDVITGLAQLGEIYLRILDRIRTFYASDPKRWFEARTLMAKAGYEMEEPSMEQMVDELLLECAAFQVEDSDKALFYQHARMFNDPILTQENIIAFTSCGEEERDLLRERIRQQLNVFPDPQLGGGDLIRFGYKGYDLFPVRKEIALELAAKRTISVYGIFADGSKKALSNPQSIASHQGMFGILKQEWISTYLNAAGKEALCQVSFRETKKEYRIYQWDDTAKKDYRFMPYEMLKDMDVKIDVSCYQLIYESTIRESATLDDIFEMFNIDHPDDFTGHSLSVSDVIAFLEDGTWNAYFVDSFGFQKIDDFFDPPIEKEIAPEEEKEDPLLTYPAPREAAESKEPEETKQKPKRIR